MHNFRVAAFPHNTEGEVRHYTSNVKPSNGCNHRILAIGTFWSNDVGCNVAGQKIQLTVDTQLTKYSTGQVSDFGTTWTLKKI
jgi:hypothetical protein